MLSVRSSATLAIGFGERRLPYLYSGSMERACQSIARKGFDAVELLVPSPDHISHQEIQSCLAYHGLALSAIGTGGAYITRKLHLCSPDPMVRSEAERFVEDTICFASPFGAIVILGLVTGFLEPGISRALALDWLIPALDRLGRYAAERNVKLVIEPLNRYESNLINLLEDGVNLVAQMEADGVELLADLFHMNIEESSLQRAIQHAGNLIGHVHFADSNRWSPGMGHTDFASVVKALDEVGYSGYISIEAFPYPDSETAAMRAIDSCRHWFTWEVACGQGELGGSRRENGNR